MIKRDNQQLEVRKFMYDTQNIAFVIKKTAKEKDISIKQLLDDCQLNINTISELSKGKQISYLSFAKIADYLDVSVDYLLGREENPEKKYDATISQVAEAFSKLSFSDKAKVMNLIAELSEKNNE